MQRTIVGRSLAYLLLLSLVLPVTAPSYARGGFGGHGGGGFGERGGGGFGAGYGEREMGRGYGGEFRGGMDDGMRSDGFRNFDRPFGEGSDWGRMDDGAFGRDSFAGAGDVGRGAAMDNGVRNYGAQRNLASDNGFSNALRPGGGAVASGNRTWRATPATLANQGRGVRGAFNNWNAFHGNWWGNYPNAWRRGWWGNDWGWGWTSWAGLAGLWGIGLSEWPVYYDYGDNITYDDSGNVDYGTEPVCTAADYYQQAVDLSSSGQVDDYASAPTPPTGATTNAAVAEFNKKDESGWKSFGVYSLAQGGQTNSSMLFQICTNTKGQIRGNYFNALTDESEPIKGAIDKKRMRAAWTVGKDSKVVYDTGVSNLLKDQSPILVHYGKDTTQQWTLVRIKNQNQNTDSSKSKA